MLEMTNTLRSFGPSGSEPEPLGERTFLTIEAGRLKELLERRVAQRTAELVAANAALARANQSKSEFLATMSHEIRTPLTIILCYADTLKQECAQLPAAIDALAKIKQSGDHLLEVINDVLDLSKIEAEKLEIELIPCSPIQLLADVDSLMRVRAEAKGLTFSVTYGSAIPATIQSDPTRLRQILINLVGNAIKFTEQGHVRLATRLTRTANGEPALRFDVVDTGIGMSDAQVGKLFHPFSQAESSTTRRFGGTGLGLAISKQLAGLLGGSVTAESIYGLGSEFSLVVPTGPLQQSELIEHPCVAIAAEKRGRAEAERSAKFPPLQARVLLAEDRADSRRLISKVLTVGGADVTHAVNGEETVRLALEAHRLGQPFDVVLMDMQMPLLDGYTATELLRQNDYAGVIIALTAHAMNGDEQKCLESGCDDYISKPVDRKRLIALIAKYQKAKAPTRA